MSSMQGPAIFLTQLSRPDGARIETSAVAFDDFSGGASVRTTNRRILGIK